MAPSCSRARGASAEDASKLADCGIATGAVLNIALRPPGAAAPMSRVREWPSRRGFSARSIDRPCGRAAGRAVGRAVGRSIGRSAVRSAGYLCTPIAGNASSDERLSPHVAETGESAPQPGATQRRACWKRLVLHPLAHPPPTPPTTRSPPLPRSLPPPPSPHPPSPPASSRDSASSVASASPSIAPGHGFNVCRYFCEWNGNLGEGCGMGGFVPLGFTLHTRSGTPSAAGS